MNKKVVIMVSFIAIVVLLILIGVSIKSTEKSKLQEIVNSDDLSVIIEKIYEGIEKLYPTLETNIINVEDVENVRYVTGLENGDELQYLAVSEPMMSGQPYSLVLAKVKDGVNADNIARNMAENVDTAKWICVSAEKLYATSSGKIVCLVMANDEIAKPVFERFKDLAGVTGKIYEKTEELPE